MLANALATAAFVITITVGFMWYRRMQAVEIPADRRAFIAAMAAALALGVASILLKPTPWVGPAMAWIAAVGGATFVALNLLSGQEEKPPAATVGQPLPRFSGVDDGGSRFEVASLDGRPLLLKFFRGHW